MFRRTRENTRAPGPNIHATLKTPPDSLSEIYLLKGPNRTPNRPRSRASPTRSLLLLSLLLSPRLVSTASILPSPTAMLLQIANEMSIRTATLETIATANDAKEQLRRCNEENARLRRKLNEERDSHAAELQKMQSEADLRIRSFPEAFFPRFLRLIEALDHPICLKVAPIRKSLTAKGPPVV